MLVFLSKFIQAFILPPGLFIILLLLASFYAKKFRYLFLSSAILLWLFSTTIFATYINSFSSLDLAVNCQKLKSDNVSLDGIDGVVVLGGGVIEKSPSFTLPADSFKKFVYGMYLAKKNSTALIFSGKGLKSLSESDAAKETLTKLTTIFNIGYESKNIIDNKKFSIYFEDRSLTTYENAKYTKELFLKSSISSPKVALVTTPYHISRAKELFESFGFYVIAKPTECLDEIKIDFTYTAFLPNMYSMLNSFIATRELIGKLWGAILLNFNA